MGGIFATTGGGGGGQKSSAISQTRPFWRKQALFWAKFVGPAHLAKPVVSDIICRTTSHTNFGRN